MESEISAFSTDRRYRWFAHHEARATSPTYSVLADGIADDQDLLALIERLPLPKRQPNLLLAAVRLHGGPIDGYPAFRAWLLDHWDRVEATMRCRSTQTNEPARCAVLLPLLAALPQPLALIEVGASAGLCLHPDRYRYSYDAAPPIGAPGARPLLECATSGRVPVPDEVPRVAWRAGIDLNPLDPSDPDDVRWLECLVWPGRHDRLERLRAALETASLHPAPVIQGDLTQALASLLQQVPDGATPVVFHSAVLPYLAEDKRREFVALVQDGPCHWISNESPAALPDVRRALPSTAPFRTGDFVVALDGRPKAVAAPHGQYLKWSD
ncbi:DUF2332 domain-containing protein [Nocardiopsis sp. RSe5-2]|uniref:DUF2332 domain-containing protein n=1 Tax=Nocardiopsis endophytica TaxID=3018445 RepID=A0ABT4U511_9ACTN|nr:DUF2332 domain-containing protein [Nocardiopsis endophytica]MDA2811791.1 DUF2332 domain-containing protein [Nocardiopsis endophytica]